MKTQTLKKILAMALALAFQAFLFHAEVDAQPLKDSLTSWSTRYYGFELSYGYRATSVTSNLPQFNHLMVMMDGVNGGLVAANNFGKFTLRAGKYYSGASVPFTVDMEQIGFTSNVYLLRLFEKRYHTLEPYAVLGVSHQQIKMFGNLTAVDEPTGNFHEDLMTSVQWTQYSGGIGVEYQLESNTHKFIHLFAELCMAGSIYLKKSDLLNQTQLNNPTAITIGVSFGKMK